MGAKRVLLIAGGTVGGLGAVLSITPPQFGSSGGGTLSGHTLGGGTTTTAPATPATPAAPTKPPVVSGGGEDDGGGTIGAKPKPAPSATKKAPTKKGATSTPAPSATSAAPVAPAKASGTFSGSTQNTRYGPVQVEITVSNGKITAAKALQYPKNDYRSQQISQQAIPFLVQETLAANSANIQGVGGASYTSQGWYDSLLSALAKAGM